MRASGAAGVRGRTLRHGRRGWHLSGARRDYPRGNLALHGVEAFAQLALLQREPLQAFVVCAGRFSVERSDHGITETMLRLSCTVRNSNVASRRRWVLHARAARSGRNAMGGCRVARRVRTGSRGARLAVRPALSALTPYTRVSCVRWRAPA